MLDSLSVPLRETSINSPSNSISPPSSPSIFNGRSENMEGTKSYPEGNDNTKTQTGRTAVPKKTTSFSPGTTSVHITALDGLVNVNSLFTVAVFVGLSFTTPGQHSLAKSPACDAGDEAARRLVVFEVVSFSFFLFSSFVAQGLKLAMNILNSKEVEEAFHANINIRVLTCGMLASAVGSVLGCMFLLLSLVHFIEILLGTLSCGSKHTIYTVASLIILVISGIVCYISITVYAFLR